MIVPEIADFEVRRNLIFERKTASIASLNQLKGLLVYQPITTKTMLKADKLRADVRRRGRPTADPKGTGRRRNSAAQAIEADAIIATENVGHFSRYVAARHWSAIIAS